MTDINDIIRTPLTDSNIVKYGVPKEDIIVYSDLGDEYDIEGLLTDEHPYKIMLIEYKENSGHWVLIMKYVLKGKKVLEYFNPFGLYPSKADFVDDAVLNKKLDQEQLFLNQLFHKEESEEDFDDLIYNKVKFQSRADDVNTCGRHCLMRLICMKDFNMDLADYIKFMKKFSKKLDASYDEIVASIIQ